MFPAKTTSKHVPWSRKLAALITAMSAGADVANITKVASDPAFRKEMYEKYGIK